MRILRAYHVCRSTRCPYHTQRVIISSLAAAVRNTPGGCAALVALNQPHHLPAFDRVVHLEHGRVQAVRSVVEVLAAPDDPSDALNQMLRAAGRGGGSVDETPGAIPGEISGELAAPAAVPAADADADANTDADADANVTPNAAAAAEAKGAPKLQTALVEKEGKRDGGYAGSIFLHYARAMGYCQIGVYLVLVVLAYTTFAGTDMMLSRWLQACMNRARTIHAPCMHHAGNVHAPCMHRACTIHAP